MKVALYGQRHHCRGVSTSCRKLLLLCAGHPCVCWAEAPLAEGATAFPVTLSGGVMCDLPLRHLQYFVTPGCWPSEPPPPKSPKSTAPQGKVPQPREFQWDHPPMTNQFLLLAAARKLSASREILLWMTPSEAPKALQASECSELLDPIRANCRIPAQD